MVPDESTKGMSEDTKQLQVVVQRASGVSSALWPASAQRCVATSKVAQRRRSMIIKGKRWAVFVPYSPLSLSLALIVVTSMAMSGAVVAALAWHQWYMLLIALLLLPLLLNVRAKTDVQAFLFSLQRTMHARSWPGSGRSEGKQGFPAKGAPLRIPGEPKTPMPESPFVRVLETVDLSQSDVEHFIGANAGSDENTGAGEGKERERDTAARVLNLRANLPSAKKTVRG